MLENAFINILFAHIVGDFYFQWNSLCRDKILHQAKGWGLWVHAIIIGILTWCCMWCVESWWIAALIVIVHSLIDYLKSYVQKKFSLYEVSANGEIKEGNNNRYDLYVFVGDQILHMISLLAIAYVWTKTNCDWKQFECLNTLCTEHPLRVKLVLAILLALKPANILIVKIMNSCKVAIQNDDHGNFHSGELIGNIERCLMIFFVVLGQYEAIGFLIAAKSILRFGEANSDKEKSEYVLTGTLLSLVIAISLGLAVIKL